jgi:UDP-glucose 4-epimerase
MAAKALIPESEKYPEPFYTCNLVGGMTLLNGVVRMDVISRKVIGLNIP